MPLLPGAKLGPYEVQSQLGAGGMGEVYLARDTRLERKVAIKILPESFAADADRLERFAQEARVLSSLNHPGLLTIYDFGNENGMHYLVSEYLDGQTLRTAGALPRRKILDYARQLAAALAAAHDRGIVHRDLKPENIFITTEERVKILDFGLAKKARSEDAFEGPTASLNAPADTAPGTVMGTVGYMSPEQVRGQVVDHRSDIFSFGSIAYEMVSGNRAFQRASGIETMHAILNDDPPELDLNELKVSPAAERIVRHCLEKNPADRFQSARDLGFALSALSGSGSAPILAAPPAKAVAPWPVYSALGVAVLAIVALTLAMALRKSPPPAQRLEFALPLTAEISHLALSADGHMLAVVSPDDSTGANILTVQRIGSPGVTLLPGTDGANYPFWSPDGAYLCFFADGKMKKIAVAGAVGIPQILAVATNPRGGSWGNGGVIIYSPDAGGPLWRVNPDGSDAKALTDKIFDGKVESSHRWPVFLPDGDHFFFWGGNFSNTTDDHLSGIFISSLAGSKRTKLVVAHSNPGYMDGRLLYVDENKHLLAVPVDVAKERFNGQVSTIAESIGFQPSTYYASFTNSDNGTVVYYTGAGSTLSRLIWCDRTGKELGTVGEPGVIANPTISPDGNFAVVDRTDVKANNVDLWIEDLHHGTASRFTFDPAEEVSGTWSRDGKTLAYRSTASGVTLLTKKVQGLEPGKSLFTDVAVGEIIPTAWSLDGRVLLCTVQPNGGVSNLALFPLTAPAPVPFLKSNFSLTSGQISPDGKYVSYASNESGDWEIYVSTFPDGAGKWQISRGGGTEARWNPNGKEIFYVGAHNMLYAVAIDSARNFAGGALSLLFQIRARAQNSSTDLFTYDVADDGKRFLVNRYTKPEHIRPLTVVLNATAGLASTK